MFTFASLTSHCCCCGSCHDIPGKVNIEPVNHLFVEESSLPASGDPFSSAMGHLAAGAYSMPLPLAVNIAIVRVGAVVVSRRLLPHWSTGTRETECHGQLGWGRTRQPFATLENCTAAGLAMATKRSHKENS